MKNSIIDLFDEKNQWLFFFIKNQWLICLMKKSVIDLFDEKKSMFYKQLYK